MDPSKRTQRRQMSLEEEEAERRRKAVLIHSADNIQEFDQEIQFCLITTTSTSLVGHRFCFCCRPLHYSHQSIESIMRIRLNPLCGLFFFRFSNRAIFFLGTRIFLLRVLSVSLFWGW